MSTASSTLCDRESLNLHLGEWRTQAGKRPLRILVGGKAGAGKSALINNLLGEQLCEEGSGPNGMTTCVQMFETTLDGVRIQIFDTPGLESTKRRDSKIIAEMSLAVQDQASKEVDLFFYCKSIIEHFTEEDVRILKLLTHFYGGELWKHGIIVLTMANRVSVWEKPRYRETVAQYVEEVKNVLQKKLKVHMSIVNDLPAHAAGYTDPVIPCEDEVEDDSVSVTSSIESDHPKWMNRLLIAAFKRADPKSVPALFDVTLGKAVSIKRAVAVGMAVIVPAAAVGAGVGAGIGFAVPVGGEIVGSLVGAAIGAGVGGPPGAIAAAALGGCSRVLYHKFEMWKLSRSKQNDEYKLLATEEC